jgi:hypothetical protein
MARRPQPCPEAPYHCPWSPGSAANDLPEITGRRHRLPPPTSDPRRGVGGLSPFPRQTVASVVSQDSARGTLAIGMNGPVA